MRVLLLADTHLGFDLPRRSGGRLRRGEDFFSNTRRALAPALAGEVDLVVHGGDLLFRSQVEAGLVARALEPFLQVCDRGVPVVLTPGNHERSRLPFPLLASHRHLHVLEEPRTVALSIRGERVAVSGFACVRDGIRDRFGDLVEATGWRLEGADVRLLVVHQTVEGATVGPSDYVFRSGPDVIRGRDIPAGFAAVLAGHIHRHQVLRSDLRDRRLAAPVFYPGSIERTSRAEAGEEKGYVILDVVGGETGGRVVDHQFLRLPSRPLVEMESGALSLAEMRRRLEAIDPRAVVRVHGHRQVPPTMAELRSVAPATMILEADWRGTNRHVH